MAVRKKKSKRKASSAERKFEVRAEVANFTLAKAGSCRYGTIMSASAQ